MINSYKVLVGGKTPLEIYRRRWEDNIKMEFKDCRCDDVDWMHVAQDRDQW
jgi:hypothetical protein